MKKVIVIVGTRSEVIKFSSLIRAMKSDDFFDLRILHTGQHNTGNLMSKLDLPEPTYYLGESLRRKWSKLGKMKSSLLSVVWLWKVFFRMRSIFSAEKPDAIFYQGNCMTVPIAVFAAKTIPRKIVLIHRESGIRTHNYFEPFLGEISEKVGDYFGDILFAPSSFAENNLRKEKIKGRIYNTGDPHVEIVEYIMKKKLRKISEDYVLVNVLHFENVADRRKMENLVEILTKSPMKIVFPMSASVKGRLELFGLLQKLKQNKNVVLHDAYGYVEFLNLLKNSRAVLTDSGGVQQESLIMHVPCIFLGKENVWREFESRGLIKSSGFDVEKTLDLLEEIRNHGEFYKKIEQAKYPIGDGNATKRMIDIMKKELVKI